jgi:hypothetical protein
MPLNERCDTGLQHFQILKVSHAPLVVAEPPELAFAKTGESRRQGLHQVTELLEGDSCAMDGLRVLGIHGSTMAHDF